MPVILPLPWRAQKVAAKTNPRVAVVYHGGRRLSVAVGENGKLLHSAARFDLRGGFENKLSPEGLLEFFEVHLQKQDPGKVLLLWGRESEKAAVGRAFIMGQITIMLKMICKRMGKYAVDCHLEDLKQSIYGDRFVSNKELLSEVQGAFPGMREDEALAAFAAILTTAPSLLQKKIRH